MQRIYQVFTPTQLELYADDIGAGIETILEDARDHDRDIRTREEIWDELVEHVHLAPHGRLLLSLEDGVLVAWLAGKIYVDGKRKNGCITWAWARTGCHVSRAMLDQMEAYFRDQGCQRAYLGRSFLQPSFTRLMRHYGYSMSSVVYEKPLSEVRHVSAVRSASGTSAEDVPERDTDAMAANGSESTRATAHGFDEPGDDGPTGEAPGDSGGDAAPASGVELPGDDADAPAIGVGLPGGAAVTADREHGIERNGGGGDGGERCRDTGLDDGSGRESSGPPDTGAARAAGS